MGITITPRLATSWRYSDRASVGATPEPSPSCIVRGTPTNTMPSMPASDRSTSRRCNDGSSMNAVTCVHRPWTPANSGLMIDQKSSTSSFGCIGMGLSSSSAIIPGIITCRIRPSSPDAAEYCTTLRASSIARSLPPSRFGGTSSSAIVLRVTRLLFVKRVLPWPPMGPPVGRAARANRHPGPGRTSQPKGAEDSINTK